MAQADDIIANVEAQLANAAKALTLEITANLIVATPVKTGFARASWVPSIGSPSSAEPSTPFEAEFVQTGGEASILNFTFAQGSVFVTNNARYIERLNLGSSSQAAAGFVEVAIEQALATVNARYQTFQLDVTTKGAGTFSDVAGGLAASNMASAFSPFGADG